MRIPLALIAVIAGTSPALSQELADGRQDFITYCASCHGQEGKGDGPVAEFLALIPADLTQLAKANGGIFLRERVAEAIDGRREVRTHGTRDMPVWGDWFSIESDAPDQEREKTVQQRITALVDYINTLQTK